MTVFPIVAGLLLLVALACVLVPLLRSRRATPVDQATSNLAILRDLLAELDADSAAGTLSKAQYDEARQELERRVFEEVKPREERSPAVAAGRWQIAGLGIGVAIAAVVLYLQIGTPDGLTPRADVQGGGVAHGEMSELITKLAARLERQPDEEGFVLLARSYYSERRYAEAARAYERGGAVVMNDPDVLSDYADALAAAQGRRLAGKPLELALRAIAIDPNHPKALALAGSEAFERKDYRGAIGFWERIRGDSAFNQVIAASIEEARELGNIKTSGKPSAPPQAAAMTPSIAGIVKLGPGLSNQVSNEDTVFIFARAAEGPRMPLAIVRQRVKDLPYTFSLDDSQAMAPNMKLSGASAVIVGARISKSGDATPRTGDLQGFSGTVKLGATGVAVVIDSVVP